MKYELSVDRCAIDNVMEDIYTGGKLLNAWCIECFGMVKGGKNFIIEKYSVWEYYTLFVKQLQNGNV